MFSGSLNDHLGRLEWDQQLPNFWSVPILDENKYSYIQLKRDCLIQDCLKRPREQNEVLLVYESNPDWLIMIDETNDPLKRSQLYIFDLATVKEENILRKFEVNFIRVLQRNINSYIGQFFRDQFVRFCRIPSKFYLNFPKNYIFTLNLKPKSKNLIIYITKTSKKYKLFQLIIFNVLSRN